MWRPDRMTVNPYDPYVANKIVNGSQCTVVWHINDLKVSHKDEAVTAYFAQELGRQKPGQDQDQERQGV